MKTVDFSETVEACDLKVGRYRQLIEIMKVCEYLRSWSLIYHIFFQVLYVLCFTRPRYQVSVYRTIGPLVFHYGFDSTITQRTHAIYCIISRL